MSNLSQRFKDLHPVWFGPYDIPSAIDPYIGLIRQSDMNQKRGWYVTCFSYNENTTPPIPIFIWWIPPVSQHTFDFESVHPYSNKENALAVKRHAEKKILYENEEAMVMNRQEVLDLFNMMQL